MTAEGLQALLDNAYAVEPGHALKRSPLTLAIRLALHNDWRGAFVPPSPWASAA